MPHILYIVLTKRMISVKIDLEVLKVLELNINQILTLIKIYLLSKKQLFDYQIKDSDLEFLRENKYIIYYTDKNIKYFIRDKGNIILKKAVEFEKNDKSEVEVTSKKESKDVIEGLDIKVKKFRSRFNGLKVGSMGSLASVKNKLSRWMKTNPEVTFKEILAATDLYIESLNGDYRYLQRADYFIYKQNTSKEESSRLSIFIEEGNREIVNSDWGANIT